MHASWAPVQTLGLTVSLSLHQLRKRNVSRFKALAEVERSETGPRECMSATAVRSDGEAVRLQSRGNVDSCGSEAFLPDGVSVGHPFTPA